MKRSINSSSSLQPLKRANSSLFSIATLVDDDSNVDSLIGNTLNIDEQPNCAIKNKVRTVSTSSDSPPLLRALGDEALPGDEDLTSCSDDESELSPELADKEELVLCQTASQNVAQTIKTVVAREKDNRTGLIFEAASKHFDRYNKLHKERPMRITCVRDYLTSQKPDQDGMLTIFERCQLNLLDKREGIRSAEELFLDDDDYLRVHLPGYMQR